MTPALTVTGLAKRYGRATAVAEVSLTVEPGAIVGLLGPNGAGKSTVVECIVGLRRPDAGIIRVGEVDAVASPRAAARLLGAQLQATALQDAITAREALVLFRSFHAQGADVDRLLAEVDLAPRANVRFAILSQGERQRLALALALVNDPRLLVLDEPTAGLDPLARRAVHRIVRERAAQGVGVLLATQLIEEAERLCDRVVVVAGGRVAASGTAAELVARTGQGTLEEAFIALTGREAAESACPAS